MIGSLLANNRKMFYAPGNSLAARQGFSLGHVMARRQADYRELPGQADQRMYENKRERKKV